jgi:hypothetical protein
MNTNKRKQLASLTDENFEDVGYMTNMAPE